MTTQILTTALSDDALEAVTGAGAKNAALIGGAYGAAGVGTGALLAGPAGALVGGVMGSVGGFVIGMLTPDDPPPAAAPATGRRR